MSEISKNQKARLKKLKEASYQILKTGSAQSFIKNNEEFIQQIVPMDFIPLFDEIIQEGYPMEDIKTLTNKILNIFYSPIVNYPTLEPKENTFLGVLVRNNTEMEQRLNRIRPIYKKFLKKRDAYQADLEEMFRDLEIFASHYTIKENILFPILEKYWADYRCLQIMWSFHDDIRRNIKEVIEQLSTNEIEIKRFNRAVGDIFFNMLAIKFREEKILFPHILESIEDEDLAQMTQQGREIGYPYHQPDDNIDNSKISITHTTSDTINLGTGEVSVDQIKLIFNHLPVDITFVDEYNKVKYFSTPKHRIFPRTTAIIGREVSNCHPPESVHVVENIVESFRKGEQDHADFWIKMKGMFILIQYFAVRDAKGNYKGVVEVSQEISGIKELEGEKRLLDW